LFSILFSEKKYDAYIELDKNSISDDRIQYYDNKTEAINDDYKKLPVTKATYF
jgi:hypothetical protein